MPSKRYCNCVTCEAIGGGALDYRLNVTISVKGMGLAHFEPRPCFLCAYRLEPEDLDPTDPYAASGMVKQPLVVPNGVKDFLGCEYLCYSCLHGIHWQIRHGFRVCWAEVSVEVVQCAVVSVLNEILKQAIRYRQPRAIEERKEMARFKALWEIERKKGVEEVDDLPIYPRIRRRDIDA